MEGNITAVLRQDLECIAAVHCLKARMAAHGTCLLAKLPLSRDDDFCSCTALD
jgi:hypothetical protein